jgi:hypothetical protein
MVEPRALKKKQQQQLPKLVVEPQPLPRYILPI